MPEGALSLVVLCHEPDNGWGLPSLGPAHGAAIKLKNSFPAQLRQ
jgi:hypothetical protein